MRAHRLEEQENNRVVRQNMRDAEESVRLRREGMPGDSAAVNIPIVVLENPQNMTWAGKTGVCESYDAHSETWRVLLDDVGDLAKLSFEQRLVVLHSSEFRPYAPARASPRCYYLTFNEFYVYCKENLYAIQETKDG